MNRRYAEITTEQLRKKVIGLLDDGQDESELGYPILDAVANDLKVSFDFENFSIDPSDGHLVGYHALGKLNFLGCLAHGDWETYPVFFIVYWDDTRLRAYVPSDGNPYNKETKSAYVRTDVIEASHDWIRISDDINHRFSQPNVAEIGMHADKMAKLLKEVWIASQGEWNQWILNYGAAWSDEVEDILESHDA